MPDLARVHIVVTGVVQGVGYRYFAMQLARDYGLVGWVRNREDGAVELEAQGEEIVVQAYVKDLRVGPRNADVTGVEVNRLAPGEPGKGFHVR
jgi:acylphosphatase